MTSSRIHEGSTDHWGETSNRNIELACAITFEIPVIPDQSSTVYLEMAMKWNNQGMNEWMHACMNECMHDLYKIAQDCTSIMKHQWRALKSVFQTRAAVSDRAAWPTSVQAPISKLWMRYTITAHHGLQKAMTKQHKSQLSCLDLL